MAGILKAHPVRHLTVEYDHCQATRAGGYACIREDRHAGPHYYRDAHGRRPPAPPVRPALDKREPDPRAALVAAVARNGKVTLTALSRLIDRPAGYLGRFVGDGVPRALRPDEHRKLANFFGLDERGLGVRDLWAGICSRDFPC